jgi:hypothetical protein
MSKNTLTDGPARVKPETPPGGIVAMLRMLEDSCREGEAVAAANVARLCRMLEERE